MIRVNLFDSGPKSVNRMFCYSANGHSNSQYGAVCTAVSVIGYTLAGYLYNLMERHEGTLECKMIEDPKVGYLCVEVLVKSPILMPKVQAVFEAAYIGVHQVSACDGHGEVEIVGAGTFSDLLVLTKPTENSTIMLKQGHGHHYSGDLESALECSTPETPQPQTFHGSACNLIAIDIN